MSAINNIDHKFIRFSGSLTGSDYYTLLMLHRVIDAHRDGDDDRDEDACSDHECSYGR